jgi:hypothetical protein
MAWAFFLGLAAVAGFIASVAQIRGFLARLQRRDGAAWAPAPSRRSAAVPQRRLLAATP